MKAKGYILPLSEERYSVLRGSGLRVFGEPVPSFQHSRNSILICLIVNGKGVVTHFGKSRRGVNAGTDLSRLNISEIKAIPERITLQQISEAAESHDRKRIQHYIERKGLIPPATFASVVDVITRIAPSAQAILAKYGNRQREAVGRLPERTRSALAEQKETIATALSVAGIGREQLQTWELPHDASPLSFLDGLKAARLREDQMVMNDFRKFPGFEFVKELPYSAAVFQNHTTRLTTILANRLPLEEVLGTDLVYYNEAFASFVFVQYKALEYCDGEKGYRLPNKQLETEIARMHGVLTALRSMSGSNDISDFRMNNNPFFLKFCSRMVFEPDDSSLVPGMYIPLDMWDALIRSDRTNGSRGGKVISYQNVERYFDNTEFCNFVAKSWVGTNRTQSAFLAQQVRDIVESGRAITIAIKTKLPPVMDDGVYEMGFDIDRQGDAPVPF